ncbi:MAG: hypothetical protein GEU83_13665 [Pseudonocardiaceae bacterium]|nr:hypothetical protein [Pseudonocardiaceae bacterium]
MNPGRPRVREGPRCADHVRPSQLALVAGSRAGHSGAGRSPPCEHPAALRPIEQQRLLDEPQDLLVPLDHPLAGRADAVLEETAHDPWVLPAPGSCDQHELALVACAAAGFSPAVVHEVKEWSAVASLVARGLGVCLMPRLVRIPAELPIARVPLRDAPTPRRRLLSCTRRGSRQQRHIALGLKALTTAARTTTTSTTPTGALGSSP